MRCSKCSGLLVAERHLDFYGPAARWKCINCGWSRTENQLAQSLVERATSCRSRKPGPT
jgi:ribosomal protein S27AE